ncbi:unnamed protein product [Clonostachys byssicola]|uniref:Alcohol dehydrogenase-like N-terminal domain-containing protein n=1 Tax=Clonostachys byssicola TaxID=160290 RepID=A0A9N9Y0W2_9HYPO|nr:unnamed protein product [Clonostachys byssicola]
MVMATGAVSARETIPLPTTQLEQYAVQPFQQSPATSFSYIPKYQKAMILHGIRQPYELTDEHPVPVPSQPDELVVKLYALGLNPIDWKSVDYGYGIPNLPYVAGRDFAGVVVKAPQAAGDLREGDIVLCASTDYRDVRKAAYQEYALALRHTVCKLAHHTTPEQGACLGVAYVAATLALGSCLGVKLAAPKLSQSVDLFGLVRSIPASQVPEDIRAECLDSTLPEERPRPGDWIVIWGGSSTSALFLSQIAGWAGLKVILVVDAAKHGAKLAETGSTLVDCQDAERAVEVIRGITGGNLLYGIDTVGKDTAARLAECMGPNSERRGHLVALAAPPKQRLEGVVYHSVPIKLFHEVPVVGQSLMSWLEMALESRLLALPSVSLVPGGLQGINTGLDQMRQGKVSGRRLVVPLKA